MFVACCFVVFVIRWLVGLDFGGCVLLLFDFALLISFVVYLHCCLVWVFMAVGYFVVLFICDLGFVGGL